MEEQDIMAGIASDDFAYDLDELDSFGDEIDKAMPEWDRWNDDLKKLLPEKERDENKEMQKPRSVPEMRRPSDESEVRAGEQKPAETSKLGDLITSDKQLLFFVHKYRKADRICREAGISLQTLQKKVGQLSYKLKRYIDVEGLYRDTTPVKLTSEGIRITRDHLLETDFKAGDRFKVGFKDKYILLTKI
ncbi:MAG: hypothetical protein U5R49_16190 [Deltaproteobacteria bacterium]|nr:hypothetical protein [Deltaproteobacteria bacterium]